jgi:hypothetical protein
MESVMKDQRGFDVALVVPPVNAAMSAHAQDTRLMTIMCTLRAVCEANHLPSIHVVGENKLESSAGLALRPKTDESIDETDFVNVQAIIARALCQAMAFPFMQPAVVQLFDSVEKTPFIYIVPATLFVPVNYKISFSDLIEEIKEECNDHICIGYRKVEPDKVRQVLCPKLDEELEFGEQDSVVIISRQQPGVKGTMAPPNKSLEVARTIAITEPTGSPKEMEMEPFMLPSAIGS